MTQKKLTSTEQLDRLADTLVEDILHMSDAEVIAEAQEQFNDPQAEIGQVRGLVQSAILRTSKAKLAGARAAVAAYKQGKNTADVVPLSTGEKKAVIDRFISQDPALKEKVTLLAARKGEGIQSDSDIEGMFEDLIELGLIDEQGNTL
jgi:hypothetical protein